MKGYLCKKSPSMLKGWQQRYVTLKDKKLRYFKNDKAKFASGCINFEFYEVKIERNEKDPCIFTLKIEGNDREFIFKAATLESSTDWITELHKHIGSSEGFL